MNLTETDIILLEDYWAGRLAAREQEELETRLAEDKAFRAAAAEWQLIVEEAWMPPMEEIEEQTAIKNRLLSYAATETTEETSAKVVKSDRFRLRRMSYIGLAAAASVALLWWVGGISGQADPMNDFFAHLPRENANLSNEAKDGKQAYDQRDYETAYAALLAEVAAGEDSLNLIYAGVAAIGSGQPLKAIPVLEPLVNRTNWEFYQAEIQWYLALAYWETGDVDKAKVYLQAVASTKGVYAEQAKALIDQIKTAE